MLDVGLFMYNKFIKCTKIEIHNIARGNVTTKQKKKIITDSFHDPLSIYIAQRDEKRPTYSAIEEISCAIT